eukprot:CAMPEP_0119406580 /NCGR_PEP_ID=MMETSP1335-20130426/857_1 /TAXON_ID=259385 /ORGANISM="Chrysoculter rhomboideus, Strain RCC1486" /LENGTH=369 /DNA_ID=CAMNT_0007430667 /DNA_START=85 /DNA_END=1194 /DNA_ORIENTATION=-
MDGYSYELIDVFNATRSLCTDEFKCDCDIPFVNISMCRCENTDLFNSTNATHPLCEPCTCGVYRIVGRLYDETDSSNSQDPCERDGPCKTVTRARHWANFDPRFTMLPPLILLGCAGVLLCKWLMRARVVINRRRHGDRRASEPVQVITRVDPAVAADALIAKLRAEPFGRLLTDDARGATDCAICLTTLQPGSSVKQLSCSHVFCAHCIDGWIRSQAATSTAAKLVVLCPLCKCELESTLPAASGAPAASPAGSAGQLLAGTSGASGDDASPSATTAADTATPSSSALPLPPLTVTATTTPAVQAARVLRSARAHLSALTVPTRTHTTARTAAPSVAAATPSSEASSAGATQVVASAESLSQTAAAPA